MDNTQSPSQTQAQPSQPPQSSTPPTSSPQSTPPPAPFSQPSAPAKSHRKLPIIILSIIAILALGAAITFAILWLNSSSQTPPEQPPAEAPATAIESAAEQEITDQAIINSLSQNVSILAMNHESATAQSLDVGDSLYVHILSKLASNSLTDSLKSTIIIDSLDGGFALTDKHTLSELNPTARSKISTEWFSEMNQYQVAQFGDPYQALFNATMPRQDVTEICPYEYIYDQNTEVFVSNSPGCGGTFFPIESLYKIKYTKEGDVFYAYVAMGSLEPKDDNGIYAIVYDDVLDHPKKTLRHISEDDSWENYITADNYTDFTQYRFVFKKSNTGTYYFVKVEQVK